MAVKKGSEPPAWFGVLVVLFTFAWSIYLGTCMIFGFKIHTSQAETTRSAKESKFWPKLKQFGGPDGEYSPHSEAAFVPLSPETALWFLLQNDTVTKFGEILDDIVIMDTVPPGCQLQESARIKVTKLNGDISGVNAQFFKSPRVYFFGGRFLHCKPLDIMWKDKKVLSKQGRFIIVTPIVLGSLMGASCCLCCCCAAYSAIQESKESAAVTEMV